MRTRLLYISPAGIGLYRWRAGVLRTEARFPQTDEGLAEFSRHVATLKHAVMHVLFDVVEEGFHVDTIPFVRGSDRIALLRRRLAQRFRDVTLATTISLGYEKTQRREERVVLTALTNGAEWQAWLDALHQARIAVSGVYTPALLAGDLARRLKRSKPRLLVVGIHACGVRQSFLDGGRARFSRLNPIAIEELHAADVVYDAIERETERLYQYLRATQLGEDGVLDALIIAPSATKRHDEFSASTAAQLRVGVIDQAVARKAIGLKDAPPELGVEALYLHLLATKRPPNQYASTAIRSNYGIRRLQVGFVVGGVAVAGACLCAAGLQLVQAYQLHQEATADIARAEQASQAHQAIVSQFPPLPTSLENLRATLEQHETLRRLAVGPRPFAVLISRALDESPHVRLDQLVWKVEPREAAQSDMLEIAELSATLPSIRPADFKMISSLVDRFAAALRSQQGLEVLDIRLPFNPGPDGTVSSGDTQDSGVDAKFVIVVARRTSI